VAQPTSQLGPSDAEQKTARANSFKNANISYQIIPGTNKTWGYDIKVDHKLMIHQPAIPGIPGNSGFSNKAAAENVAKLVIAKMKKGEMPPSVSIEEMKKIKAL
jgi:hypothetical protein